MNFSQINQDLICSESMRSLYCELHNNRPNFPLFPICRQILLSGGVLTACRFKFTFTAMMTMMMTPEERPSCTYPSKQARQITMTSKWDERRRRYGRNAMKKTSRVHALPRPAVLIALRRPAVTTAPCHNATHNTMGTTQPHAIQPQSAYSHVHTHPLLHSQRSRLESHANVLRWQATRTGGG